MLWGELNFKLAASEVISRSGHCFRHLWIWIDKSNSWENLQQIGGNSLLFVAPKFKCNLFGFKLIYFRPPMDIFSTTLVYVQIFQRLTTRVKLKFTFNVDLRNVAERTVMIVSTALVRKSTTINKFATEKCQCKHIQLQVFSSWASVNSRFHCFKWH